MNFQSFFLNGVLTEVVFNPEYKYFTIQQFREMHGGACQGYSNKENWSWFRNVSKTKKEKAIVIFKLLQQGY